MSTQDGSLDDLPTVDIARGETEAANRAVARDSDPAQPPGKYDLQEVIGRGGMGEVVLAEDKSIGRRVAIKRMRAAEPSPEEVARFLREAHIQARLDHPAIVPVHELGRDAGGRPYFTMKRLAGVTLQHVLAEAKATQQKLLRSFVDVCLAIDFAHERGIVHRDLKPSNVMLGHYGEVYVLDWGVARVIGDADLAGIAIDSLESGETQQGAVLGTVGYMSPEQMRGQEITPATDVYALGAILFELLTGEPLHPRGAAMESTLSDTVWLPSRRVPSLTVAPELDAACSRALLSTPSERGTARELADAVQRYLDGDRDLEGRRKLAAKHLAEARATRDPAEAMRFAGRALALDPESRDAADLVTRLMLTPPEPAPPELAARLDEIDHEDMARQGRYATLALFGYLSFVPILAAIGIENWRLIGGAAALVVVLQVGAIAVARRQMKGLGWATFGNAILIILIARITSPIILGPALAVSTAAALSSFTRLRISLIYGVMTMAIIGPMILDATGVWPSLITYSHDAVTIAPGAVELGPVSTPLLIGGAHIAALVITGFVVRSLASARREAQRKVEMQSWMLERLIRTST